ncbi:MAG: transposase [Gaiellaceae bacterium]|nr:MAG: transposase [Gaiellaceae bacterium]
MSFRLIEAEKAEHRVSRLCSVLGVTRQGYYARRRRPPSARRRRDGELERLVRAAFIDSHETYGAPRLHAELRAQGVRVSRKRVARLMRELSLQGVSRRGERRRVQPLSGSASPPAPDLVRRRFHASRPDELWLADITHVPTWEGWFFLSVVMDVCTRRIVGWSMREDLRAELVVDALGMAVTRRRPNGRVIHHSDRGSQYASLLFGRTLRDSGLLASMGSRGDPFDNAMCESVVSTLKEELLKRRSWKTRDEARLAVFTHIETFYNPRRRHSALGYVSPDEYERMIRKSKSNDPQIATPC